MGKREKELFTYDNGVLYWKKPTSSAVKVGDRAGCLTSNNYYIVRYDGRLRMLHRVVWDYHNGTCEGFLVDHINGDPSDNRIENLRLCNYSTNAANSRMHRDNAVGLKGVHKHSDGRYRAQICKDGKKRHLGLFETKELAHEAYVEAANKLFKSFAHGG